MSGRVNMTETLQDALRELANDGSIRTHCEGCWQWHLPCAAIYAADRLDDLELIAMRAIDMVHGCTDDDVDDEEFDQRWEALMFAVKSAEL